MDKAKHDAWANAEAYEKYVGRWSRVTAKAFLNWLDIPKNKTWLDLGCGTGALSQTILEYAQPFELLAVEPSEDFLTLAKSQIDDRRASFALGSGSDIPTKDNSIDVLVSAYVFNFIPDLEDALIEMKRVLKPEGTLAAYVWDYAAKAEFMRFFWNAASELDEDARELDEGKRFPICDPKNLKHIFETAGLKKIKVHAIDIPTYFKNFEDYWQPFLGKIGPAPGYVASLSEGKQLKLKNRLKELLPIAPDDSISLVARSWAIRGSLF